MNEMQLAAHRALSLMDLTSLNNDDTEATIQALCRRANTPAGHPAAVCVFPKFIVTARRALEHESLRDHVRIATVANFPAGTDDVEAVERQTRKAVKLGADEVDVVFPWSALIAGNEATGQALVAACREACKDRLLKVILETGELVEPTLIRRAGELAINGGADFLKTSTGKVTVNATEASVRILLETIRDSGQNVGCKVAGGIRTADEARTYLDLAASIMGDAWITPGHFRFGASSLLDDLLKTLGLDPYDAGQGDAG